MGRLLARRLPTLQSPGQEVSAAGALQCKQDILQSKVHSGLAGLASLEGLGRPREHMPLMHKGMWHLQSTYSEGLELAHHGSHQVNARTCSPSEAAGLSKWCSRVVAQ